ncbi:MAG: ABC transporter ATP-binding protein, partial [Rhizobiaceae bacterium]
MSGALLDRLWRKAEGVIDPFGDTDREVLPREGWRFILYFARQAKGPFALLLIIGGLAGIVDASLYWAVGWLIDLLDSSSPKTLIADHWPELLALLMLVLVVRAVIMIANAVVEQQVIVPHFYQKVRWQSFRRVIDQPY